MLANDFGIAEISFVIISSKGLFVKRNVCIFKKNLGILIVRWLS